MTDAGELPDIGERIEALKYYLPDNEGGELFQATCHLCYLMNGMGNTEAQVETLYLWAKEQAEESRVYMEEDEPERANEFIMGVFGH